jgi:hypothetical protein
MKKKVREMLEKIERKYPRDKREKGETHIGVDGEYLCPSDAAREEYEEIISVLGKFAGKKGTFRVVKVVSFRAAAELVGIDREEVDEYEEDIERLDLWFVVPKRVKSPFQEFGPAYGVYFKPEKK